MKRRERFTALSSPTVRICEENEKLKAQKRAKRRDTKLFHPLSGLLRCGACGMRMTPKISKPGHQIYLCENAYSTR